MEQDNGFEAKGRDWDRETLRGVGNLVADLAFTFSPEAARIEEANSELVRARRDGLKEGYSQALSDVQERLQSLINELP